VQGIRARIWIIATLAASLVALAILALTRLGSVSDGAGRPDPIVSASVGSNPSGAALPPGFVGVSLEYGAVRSYTGADPRAVNPVLIALLRNLAPGGQAPVVRVGGDSADSTWWPIRGESAPRGVNYSLNSDWLRSTAALASALRARMILGINLAADRPALAAAEARALVAGIGRRYVEALEIGNEPDVYGIFPWYQTHRGRWVYSRPHNYDLAQFINQFGQWRAAFPSVPVAGPAFAELNWLTGLSQFVESERGLRVVTLHRYPLRACIASSATPGYPTIPALLGDQSSAGVAQAVAPYVGTAHGHGLSFRVDEMNSASCSGKKGVSDTFAAALWVLDTLFNLTNVGVDGVNLHSLPGAAYELFTFKHAKSGWEAFVHPEYYGMLLFAQAFPPGAQLLPATTSPSGPVKVWATRGPDSQTRVVLINKDQENAYQVQLQVPGAASAVAQLERLQAPSASATTGVTLGGQTFANETRTGTLAAPRTETVVNTLGTYTVTLPPASAALLTPARGSGGGAP
jgi:glycosyl hydrolase family 79